MKYFLSCDWGTTSFRLRLAEADNCKIIAEEVANEGIAGTFTSWQKCGRPEEDRALFYLDVIKKYTGKIEDKTGRLLSGVPIIISGMASSSIGFIDIPYSLLPLNVAAADISTAFISATPYFDHDVLVISGIRTDDDVIRGEETQLIGCCDLLSKNISDELFIFPGTHSKHIRVADDEIVDFKTYMTGEFFELLSTQSILKTSVENEGGLTSAEYLNSFKKGVHDAAEKNLLNVAFKIRTNNLFDKLSKKENFNYLSGLLIGHELKDIAATKTINLICGYNLKVYYECALQELGLSAITKTFDAKWVDEAAVRGQYKIYKQSLI